MIIKEGYGGKPTEIKVYARNEDGQRKAELWLDQTGVKRLLKNIQMKTVRNPSAKDLREFKILEDRGGVKYKRSEVISEVDGEETLAYITLEELLELRDEINGVIQELIA